MAPAAKLVTLLSKRVVGCAGCKATDGASQGAGQLVITLHLAHDCDDKMAIFHELDAALLDAAKECKSDRSRQELSNEYLLSLAKFGFDTAANEAFNFHNFSSS